MYNIGPRKYLNNYRAISLLNTAGKVFGKKMAERLQRAAKTRRGL